MLPNEKLEQMRGGQRIITNDEEMDVMMRIDPTFFDDVRSIPNPDRVGVKDQYVAWVDHEGLKPCLYCGDYCKPNWNDKPDYCSHSCWDAANITDKDVAESRYPRQGE